MTIKYEELIKLSRKYNQIFNSLKTAINSESLAVIQYLAGIGACKCEKIKEEFEGHLKDEYRHALLLFDILKDLGGTYSLSPQSMIFNNDCGYMPPMTCLENNNILLLTDNIKAEQCAIVAYQTLLKSYDFNKNHANIIQSIIKDEEQHRDDLAKLLKEKRDL